MVLSVTTVIQLNHNQLPLRLYPSFQLCYLAMTIMITIHQILLNWYCNILHDAMTLLLFYKIVHSVNQNQDFCIFCSLNSLLLSCCLLLPYLSPECHHNYFKIGFRNSWWIRVIDALVTSNTSSIRTFFIHILFY